MKKIIAILLLIFTFFGCGEDIEFNTPSFQGSKDKSFWEANFFKANVNSQGVLTIVGSNEFESITLKVNNITLGNHDIAETTSSGSFLDADGVFYSSNSFPDSSIQLYAPSGVIDLKDVNIEEGYISGTFYFNAFNSSGLTKININKGFFYKVPLVVVAIPNPVEVEVDNACETATTVASITLINYNSVSPIDDNFIEICNAYKTALENKKSICGDTDNSIQTTINSLNCM